MALVTTPSVAAAGTLTGTTLASNVTGSSLTSVGTITSGVWSGTAIDAGSLAGATLNATVVASSLTGVGTIGSGVWNATAIATGKIAALLTSKTFDSTCALVDSTDNTKEIVWSLGGMTASRTLTLASSQSTNETLTIPNISQAETIAIVPQIAGVLVASPVAIQNTSGLMLGLSHTQAGNIITPRSTGRVSITISGVVAQNTTADGIFWHIRTGTGTAPSNGGALTGTQTGGQQSMTYLTGVLSIPFCITSYVTGAAVGTALWIDLVVGTNTGGKATMSQVMITAEEF